MCGFVYFNHLCICVWETIWILRFKVVPTGSSKDEKGDVPVAAASSDPALDVKSNQLWY